MQQPDTRTILTITVLAAFLTPFMGSAVNIALPAIGSEFKANAIMLSWISISYLLTSAMFLVPFGRLADIYGRKKIFLAGNILFVLSSILSALSNSISMLVLCRAFLGIGAAMIFCTSMAIISSVIPNEKRGKALGINVAATYTGLSAGPFIGGIMTNYLGWRSIFWINIPLGLLNIFLILKNLKGYEWAESKKEKFDKTGSAVYSVMFLTMMYGLSHVSEISGMISALVSFIILAAFIKYEEAVDAPILNIKLFKTNKVFAFSNFAALIHYSATFALTFLLSLYLQYVKGMSAHTAGAVLIAQPVMMAIFSPLAGKLSDRFEPRILASSGMALTAVGIFFFAFLTTETQILSIIAALTILGFGFAFFSSPNTNAVMCSVEKKFYGTAAGTLSTMRTIGQMLSMGLATLLIDLYIGKAQITPTNYSQFMGALQSGMFLFSGFCIAGIFLSISRGKVGVTAHASSALAK